MAGDGRGALQGMAAAAAAGRLGGHACFANAWPLLHEWGPHQEGSAALLAHAYAALAPGMGTDDVMMGRGLDTGQRLMGTGRVPSCNRVAQGAGGLTCFRHAACWVSLTASCEWLPRVHARQVHPRPKGGRRCSCRGGTPRPPGPTTGHVRPHGPPLAPMWRPPHTRTHPPAPPAGPHGPAVPAAAVPGATPTRPTPSPCCPRHRRGNCNHARHWSVSSSMHLQ